MPTNEDPSIQVRLELAEIKGMLSVSLQSHGERITANEQDIDKIHSRVNSMSRHVTTVEEQLKTSQDDRLKIHRRIAKIDERLQGQFGRNLQTLVGVVAVLGFVLSLIGVGTP